jgi:hypothetical protein
MLHLFLFPSYELSHVWRILKFLWRTYPAVRDDLYSQFTDLPCNKFILKRIFKKGYGEGRGLG